MSKKKKNKKIKKVAKGQLGKKKETAREKMIGQTIGYRYDVNLLPDYKRLHTIIERILDDISFTATDRSGEKRLLLEDQLKSISRESRNNIDI